MPSDVSRDKSQIQVIFGILPSSGIHRHQKGGCSACWNLHRRGKAYALDRLAHTTTNDKTISATTSMCGATNNLSITYQSLDWIFHYVAYDGDGFPLPKAQSTSNCLILRSRIPLRFQNVDMARKSDVKTITFISILWHCAVSSACLPFPTRA